MTSLNSWHPNCCEASVVHSTDPAGYYAVVTNRRECWQGLEQDVTDRVSVGSTYSVHARVGVLGPLVGPSDVKATLRLEYPDSATSYQFLGKKSVSKESWETVEGKFSLSTMPKRVVFYLEGPPAGVEMLIKSVAISCSSKPGGHEGSNTRHISAGDENIILNPTFEDGLKNWAGRGCKITIQEATADRETVPLAGNCFACATARTQTWNGIQQEITGRVQRKLAYQVTAMVRVSGDNNTSNGDIRITLWTRTSDSREQYIGVAHSQVTDKDWTELKGKFLLNNSPSKVVIYVEGPPAGTDILVKSLIVKHAEKTPPSPRPVIENPGFGVNLIENSSLSNGTKGWFSLGNCTLTVKHGSPETLPPIATESLGPPTYLSGRYILASNRTQTWMGPAQIITDKIKPFLTYQVSAWVRAGPSSSASQNINVAIGVDDRWVNGGQVEAGGDTWHEISGSFRIESEPSKVTVYVQGPAPGVELMVGGLQVFAVDRRSRFEHLRRQTDKIRKRDVMLKFSGSGSSSTIGPGTLVIVKQTQNSFPFGSCLLRTNMDNEDFVDFFTKNFNWAVFGNELKWYSTESQCGKPNYRDADEMLDFCGAHNIEVRGHCIFWEVESMVQSWVRSLRDDELAVAVKNRLSGLLSRYKGKFRHYDVNNEMLHGSFYMDRLGRGVRSDMFKNANRLDPSAVLFVNDYHIEDGCDPRSCPEKYIEHILDLEEQGAPVGGIGIQGHINSPVGPIVCSALDKLGILGLPIWFTELDVSSKNEHVRADDLEVMLREAYAHPAVEGVILWGFWELFMSRENSSLVNAEGEVNEAGKRFLDLKKEWLSHAHRKVDEKGEFEFRGYHGSYDVYIVTRSKTITKKIVVEKGDSPLIINIDL